MENKSKNIKKVIRNIYLGINNIIKLISIFTKVLILWSINAIIEITNTEITLLGKIVLSIMGICYVLEAIINYLKYNVKICLEVIKNDNSN